MGLDIRGLPTLEAEMQKLANAVGDRKAVKGALREGGKVIFNEMQRTAPVETGAMKSMIRESTPRYMKRTAVQIGITRDVWKRVMLASGRKLTYKRAAKGLKGASRREDDAYYPAFVEFGHGGPRPARERPWVRTAVKNSENKAIETVIDRLTDILNQNI